MIIKTKPFNSEIICKNIGILKTKDLNNFRPFSYKQVVISSKISLKRLKNLLRCTSTS